MSISHEIKVDEKVLITTARIQAALKAIPRIVGSKKEWGPWMRDNLKSELSQISKANDAFPHPKLLGSLRAMLARHYRSGMSVDTLLFDEVRADDPSVTGAGYVDVPVDVLPVLKGADFWWQLHSPSASFRIDPAPVVARLEVDPEVGSSSTRAQISSRQKQKLKVTRPPAAAQNIAIREDSPIIDHLRSHTKHYLRNGMVVRGPKGKKRAPRDEDVATAPAIKKKFKSREFVETGEEDDTQIGPLEYVSLNGQSQVDGPEGSGDAEASASALKICDACKTRGSECLWTVGAGNQKRACKVCVLAKTRCQVEGLPAIRRSHRKEKATGLRNIARGEKTERQLLDTMDERLVELENNEAARQEKMLEMMSQIANLEVEVRHLS